MSTVKPLQVALLVTRESSAATLYGMFDMFSSVGRDWQLLTGESPGHGFIKPELVSCNGEGFNSLNGAWLQPQKSFASCTTPDLICIPDLLVAPYQEIRGQYPEEVAWLTEQYARGAFIATACTGALLVAETGLLDHQECTTHWAYCEAMREHYPNIQVYGERSLVISGDEQRLLQAGGGTSWMDLALLITARFCGPEEAMRLARIYLLDWHHVGQQPYAVLSRPRNTEDALITRCQQWLAQHYESESPVAKMVEISGLNERTFARRFSKATGLSPLEYVHAMRLEEAKQMLETGEQSIEWIANEIGYEDGSFFGRLFKRKVGLTPAQYRKRFGSLRKSFSELQS